MSIREFSEEELPTVLLDLLEDPFPSSLEKFSQKLVLLPDFLDKEEVLLDEDISNPLPLPFDDFLDEEPMPSPDFFEE